MYHLVNSNFTRRHIYGIQHEISKAVTLNKFVKGIVP